MQLMDTNLAWSSSLWTVTAERTGLKMKIYRQLKKVQITGHSPLVFDSFAFADVLCNLRMEDDRLKLNLGKGAVALVAQAHDLNKV